MVKPISINIFTIIEIKMNSKLTWSQNKNPIPFFLIDRSKWGPVLPSSVWHFVNQSACSYGQMRQLILMKVAMNVSCTNAKLCIYARFIYFTSISRWCLFISKCHLSICSFCGLPVSIAHVKWLVLLNF